MEEVQIKTVSPEVLYQTDKAALDSQVSTAKEYPRNVRNAVENSIAIVAISDKIAASCSYSLMRAGKTITGPSVHIAKIIAQEWGNIRIGSRVVAVNDKDLVCEGFCWDLEKNIAIQVSVKRAIIDSSGKRYSNDMVVVTGNAGNAIAMRNAILSVIPKTVIETVYEAAISKITGDLTSEEKLIAKRVQVIKKLIDTFNVTEREILNAIGKESVEHIGVQEIAVLIGMGQAIKDNDSTVKEMFRSSRKKKGRKEQMEMARLSELKLFREHISKVKTKTDLNRIKKDLSEDEGEKKEVVDERYAEIMEGAKRKKSKAKSTIELVK